MPDFGLERELWAQGYRLVAGVDEAGRGPLAGPVVGGVIFGGLPEVLREIAQPEVQWIIYGVAMVVIVFFLPQGIVPALASWWTARRRSFGAKPEAETRTP